MIKQMFNIKSIIKASTILVIALMLNIGNINPTNAQNVFIDEATGNEFVMLPSGANMGGDEIEWVTGPKKGSLDVAPKKYYGKKDNNTRETPGDRAVGPRTTEIDGKQAVEIPSTSPLAIEGGTPYAVTDENGNEEIVYVHPDTEIEGCDVASYKAQYQAGCWSCLVIETMTSAFLHAANHGLPITKHAGTIVLIIGTLLWIIKWGLNNISSFNEVQLANILGELFKFLFKVLLAFCFIMASSKAIGEYFVRPIMSVGAIIGQNMWDQEIKEYTQEWNESFEPDDPQKAAEIARKVEENNKGGAGDVDIPDNSEAHRTGVVEAPKQVEASNVEELVQDIQKAFMSILKKQLGEIQNSCGGPCGRDCRYKSCSNPGHQEYIKTIMQKAGYGSRVDHYCQASVTAAMNKLTDEIGGQLTTVIKNAKAGCLNGISLGAVGDILLCQEGKQVYQNINVGDTVYYHDVVNSTGANKSVGGGSGHHAVTYSGSGKVISFNGDGESSLCSNFYYNVKGKVLCVSCLIREKLEKDPSLANGINKQKLTALANSSGYSRSFVNYSGGVFTSASEPLENPSIPDVQYTGPTNIIPKSIMNSILGAMRAITNTTSENMVLGRAIMCYANLENGGKWAIKLKGAEVIQMLNLPMWIEGLVLLVLGLMLTISIGYYFLDISFKMGFCVLALPITVGLWPFEATKDRITKVLSIMIKASASFAFMAIITSFGMSLVSASFGGVEDIYDKLDALNGGLDNDQRDELNKYIRDRISIFSMAFIFLVFSMYYFFNLIKEAIKTYTDHFFGDEVFGSNDPMHAGATSMTQKLGKAAATPAKGAAGLLKTQAGDKIQRAASKIGGGIGNMASKPVNGLIKMFSGGGGQRGIQGGNQGGGNP